MRTISQSTLGLLSRRQLSSCTSRRAGASPLDRLPKNYHPYTPDPAVDRWADMRRDMYLHFRFTRHNVPFIVVYGVVCPLILYYFVREYNNVHVMPGRFNADEATRFPPHTPSPVQPYRTRAEVRKLMEEAGLRPPEKSKGDEEEDEEEE